MVIFIGFTIVSCGGIFDGLIPTPPKGDAKKIVGKWINPTPISGCDPEDFYYYDEYYEFYDTGMAFFYSYDNDPNTYYDNEEDRNDSFNFIYKYTPEDKTLMMYCGPGGVIQQKVLVTFINDDKVKFEVVYYYDPTDEEYADTDYYEYSEEVYTLDRAK